MKGKLLFVLSLLALMLLACRCSVSVPMTEAQEQEVIESYLSGRTVILFGDDEFINNASPTLVEYGVNVLTATNAVEATKLANGFMEIHCVSGDVETVVHVKEPNQLFWDRENLLNPIVACDMGMMMVGFATDSEPAVSVIE